MPSERLAGKYYIDEYTGCWLWQRAKNSAGYPVVKVHGVQLFAHRLSYTIFVGAIPNGLQIDHLCRNRACINPDHLEAVTCQTNINRGAGVGGALWTPPDRCKYGHLYDDANTRVRKKRYGFARVCRACHRLEHHTRKVKYAGSE